MEKKCTKCKKIKGVSEFNKNKSKSDGYASACRVCDKEISKAYYEKNKKKQKEQIMQAKKIRISENREKYLTYLKKQSCVDCGEDNPIVLDHDHRDNTVKINSVSKLITMGYGWNTVLTEIDKCDIRCANCHRIRTAKQFGWYNSFLID